MNLELVEQIVGLMGEYPVTEISVAEEGRRVCVRRSGAGWSFAAPPAELESPETPAIVPDAESVSEEVRTLTAPMVGIFHHAEPPVPYAALIAVGQVVGSIESMKLMNEVVAEAGGRVVEILAEDGAPIEYGQALFRLSAV